MRIVWLVVEVVVGVLVAGVVAAASIGLSVEAGYDVKPWMVWALLTLSVVLAIAAGESWRRVRPRG